MPPSALPLDEPWIVAVKSCRLPQGMAWYTRFAHHTWIDVKRGDEEHWLRVEVLNEDSGAQASSIPANTARMDTRWQRDIRTHTTIRGERAQRIAAVIAELALAQHDKYASGYRAWPGPNSNTLIAELAREIPDLALDFDPNALGKDYGGWVSAGWTASKTGVRVDTLPLGLALGLHEGVEVHLLGLTAGVSLVPLRLNLPFFPALPWEERDASIRMPDKLEIDYDVQLQSDVFRMDAVHQEIKEFARAGQVRFSAVGSPYQILVQYQLLDPVPGGRAKVEAVAELRTESASQHKMSLIYFDAVLQAQLGEYVCGDLVARIRFQRGPDGRVSGSLDLERR